MQPQFLGFGIPFGTGFFANNLKACGSYDECTVSTLKIWEFGFQRLFGLERHQVAAVYDTSFVIIAPNEVVEPIIKSLAFSVDDSWRIPFLDLFTVSYYNANGNEKPYPGNLGHNIPTLQICGSVKAARLLLDAANLGENNKIVGLMACMAT